MSESGIQEDENNNPVLNESGHVANVTVTPGKKLVIPGEYFEFISDVPGKNSSLYRCLFPGCMQYKKDGKEKTLMVSNISRGNAKRHFLKHDPKNDLRHEEKWNDAIKKITADYSSSISIATMAQMRRNPIQTQENLDDWVLNFLIVDVLPINTVEKPGFIQLIAGLAPHLVLHKRTFFSKMLIKKFENRKQQLIDALSKCTDASTTADAWTCRRRSYLGEKIHWFDCDSLERKSACLGIRRIIGRHTYDVLSRLLEQLHIEFGVVKKLRGTTTDNGSNFVKAFRVAGDASTLPTDLEDLYLDEEEEEEDEDMVYFEIGEIMEGQIRDDQASANASLPLHRRCVCHLLSLIAKVDVLKIQDGNYKKLRDSTMGKLTVLWNKQTSSSLNSDIIKRHLDQLLVLRNETRLNSEFDATDCIVKLLNKKKRSLKKLFDEFRIAPFTPNEEQYLEEYVRIMGIVADALDILQGEKNVGMGFLLPTISVLKTKLNGLKKDTTITHCQPLITCLLDSINDRFYHMFSDNELRLAAICNPKFRLSWLDTDSDIRRGKNLLRAEFQRLQGVVDETETAEDDSDDGTSSTVSFPSPTKRRKSAKNFFNAIDKKN